MNKENKMHISVVIPVYGDHLCLNQLCECLTVVLSQITDKYEIIMVNDGSVTPVWQTIKALSIKDKRVKGINLS